MKVGIIGVGFVGGAVKSAYDNANIPTVCVDPAKGYTSGYEDLRDCDAVFVCVPSPVNDDGSCDTSFLEDTMEKLKDYRGIIISKVTAPPDTYITLQSQYTNLVHAPEFLTAANANSDYANGKFAIIGGLDPYRTQAAVVITAGQKYIIDIVRTDIGEASLAKYAMNSFLATKVTFYNELYKLTKRSGLDYNMVKNAISLDVRQGCSHFDVPGPDGDFGFGGACFPKDTSALLHYAETKNVELCVLKQSVNKNKIIRG